jgi:nuclear transcription factor Y, gamma
VQYYLQLAQQNQQALQQAAQPQTTTLNTSALVGQQQTIQIVQGGAQIPTISVMPQMLQASSTANAATASTPVAVSNTATQNQQPAQIVLQGLNINTVAQQQQQQHQQQQQQQQQQAQLGGGIQIVQQIVGPNGEVQQIPVRFFIAKVQ